MIILDRTTAPRSRHLVWLAPVIAVVIVFGVPAIPRMALGSDVIPGEVPPWLRPQAPIRLTLIANTDNRPLLGEFRGVRGDSVWMTTSSSQQDVVLPLAQVARFEVSQEQSPRTWRGAGIGFLAGALVGVIAGASEAKLQGDMGARIAVDATILGGLGTILGALIGTSVKNDHWTVLWSRNAGSVGDAALEGERRRQ